MNNLIMYGGIVLLILISAFFSSSEIALTSVNTSRLKNKDGEKTPLKNRLAIKLATGFESTLGAILIGNNLANNAASAIATVIVLDLLGDDFAWVATLVMTLLILTFGEVIPKVLGKRFAEKISLIIAVPLYALWIVLWPITWLFSMFINICSRLWRSSVTDSDAVSQDDLENMIEIAEDEGVLDEESCDLLQNALDFEDVLAYEVITPRVDMEAIDIGDPYEVNIKKILASTYSRIPVYEDTPDNIIGILHLNRVYKHLLDNEKIHIRKQLLPVTFVHKTMPLPDVLEKMKESKMHMVVVLDEYGGTLGILTMEDVLEQLVGEIWDETDEIEREFICIDDDHFIADGDMRIYDFFDEFDMDIEEDEDFEDDSATIGGWVTTMLDGEAGKGDSFKYENLEITVLEADEKRIEKISVTILHDKVCQEMED